MKKPLALMLAAAMVLSLAACGGEAETLSVSQSAAAGDWTFTLNQLSWRHQLEEYTTKADEGKIFLTFAGSLDFAGKTSEEFSLASDLRFSASYDGSTFTTYQLERGNGSSRMFVDPANVGWTESFEPMDEPRTYKGYLALSEEIARDLEGQIQFTVTLKEKEFTYAAQVKDALLYPIDPETVMEEARDFGSGHGQSVRWTEHAFPYSREMRYLFSPCPTKRLKKPSWEPGRPSITWTMPAARWNGFSMKMGAAEDRPIKAIRRRTIVHFSGRLTTVWALA